VVAARILAAGKPIRCLLVKNQNTCVLEEDVAEEMEKLGIYAEEVVEFRSRFRDQDAKMHRHCT
jgi:hypothetical protein